MARSLLIRGMLVGLAAGLVAFVVARLVGEGAVADAIAVEDARGHEPAGTHEVEPVSRTVQATIGLLTATTLYGVALGGLFALCVAFAAGRLGPLRARATCAVVALVGFVAVYFVPFLKYPPNPPAVGNHDTIDQRTALYAAMVALSVVFAVLAGWFGRGLHPRLGTWNAVLAAVAGYAVAVGVVMLLLPDINEVAADFPATTLWAFRVGSIAVQFAIWVTLGLLLGALTERDLGRAAEPAATGQPVRAG
jgi:Probable cobalt transporter subunit (CbtA)